MLILMRFTLLSRRGSLMLVTLMFMVALSVFAVTFLFLVIHGDRITAGQMDNKKAFYLAEAGINKARWYLLHTAPDGTTDGSWRTTAYPTAAGEGATDSRKEDFEDGSYTMWVENYTVDGSIYLTASSIVNGLARTVYQRVRMAGLQPVGWWKFDDANFSSIAVDSSGNGFDGTAMGTPTSDNNGKFGKAAIFDGMSRFSVGTGIQPSTYAGMTMAAWIKTTFNTDGVIEIIMSKWDMGADCGEASFQSMGLALSIAGEDVILHSLVFDSASSSSNDMPVVSNNLKDGAWHHVAVTCPSEDGALMYMYIDGILVQSQARVGTGFNDNSTPFEIGSGVDNCAPILGINPSFRGSIDDARIYNRVLSATEIGNIYTDATGGGLSVMPDSWGEK